jgi:hypothetical protein
MLQCSANDCDTYTNPFIYECCGGPAMLPGRLGAQGPLLLLYFRVGLARIT